MKNTKKVSLLIVVSAFFTFCLSYTPSAGKTGILLGILAVSCSAYLIFKGCAHQAEPLPRSVYTSCLAAGILASLFLVFLFSSYWSEIPSRKLLALSDTLRISKQTIVITCGLLLAIGTTYFIYLTLLTLLRFNNFYHITHEHFSPAARQAEIYPDDHRSAPEIILILLCSVGVITLCSRSSFLYPFNNWDDANCFFTVGKGMFNGQVPYRDLFEQKGPLLYFLYGLAYLVSNDSFLGAYFLEIAASFLYLLYSYRITILILKKRYPVLIPIIAFLTCTSFAFEQGGSAEELCLPLLSFSLWVILKDCSYHDLSTFELILTGFTAACVFWIKFTLTGFYIGWIIWLLWGLTHRENGKVLLRKFGLMGCGVILATVPWILYFGRSHAIRDWLTVYLYDNIFVYTEINSRASFHLLLLLRDLFGEMYSGLASFAQYNPLNLVFCTASFILLFVHRKERLSGLLFLMMITTFFFIYLGGRWFRYNSLIMSVFLAPAMCLLVLAIPKAHLLNLRIVPPLSLLLCLLCSFLLTPNRYFMKAEKEDLAQYQFQKIICQNSDSNDVTLLNYGFLDGGFYTVCNVLPNCKAFCGLNIPLHEVRDYQNYYAENGLCDYIITRFNEKMEFELYDCIAETVSDYSYRTQTYRLYKLKTLK